MEIIKKIFSWNDIQSSHRLMFFIIAIFGVVSFFWGEKIPVGGGFGWDGITYANMVKNFDTLINQDELNSYYALRILPPLIVRELLIILQLPMTNNNIIQGFELYNLTLIILICQAWKSISNQLNISLAGRWIGFSGLFINFEMSKQAFYYPVLTDVTALFFAILLLTFYIQNKPLLLFLAAVLGTFAWPLTGINGAILLIFMDKQQTTNQNIEIYEKKTTHLSSGFYRLGYAILFTSILAYIMVKTLGIEIECAAPSINVSCTLKSIITSIPSVYFIILAACILAGSKNILKEIFINITKTRVYLIILAALAIAIPPTISSLISNPELPSPANWQGVLSYILLPPKGRFLMFALSLAVFWGPAMILIIVYWRDFCREARKLGLGFTGVIGISLPWWLTCEPRGLTLTWPFLVLGIVLALEKKERTKNFKYIFTALTIAYAQFWLIINNPNVNIGTPEEGFQWAYYFMHYGFWMDSKSYNIQLPIVILSAIWMYKSITPVKKAANI